LRSLDFAENRVVVASLADTGLEDPQDSLGYRQRDQHDKRELNFAWLFGEKPRLKLDVKRNACTPSEIRIMTEQEFSQRTRESGVALSQYMLNLHYYQRRCTSNAMPYALRSLSDARQKGSPNKYRNDVPQSFGLLLRLHTVAPERTRKRKINVVKLYFSGQFLSTLALAVARLSSFCARLTHNRISGQRSKKRFVREDNKQTLHSVESIVSRLFLRIFCSFWRSIRAYNLEKLI
jgi:hypothetical protein